MNQELQTVINTLAFHAGQLVLARDNRREFLRRLIQCQRDLEQHRKNLVGGQTVVDDTDDEDLIAPLE
jgi:hypothetical protein